MHHKSRDPKWKQLSQNDSIAVLSGKNNHHSWRPIYIYYYIYAIKAMRPLQNQSIHVTFSKKMTPLQKKKGKPQHRRRHAQMHILTWTAGATAPDSTSACPAEGPPLVKNACISEITDRAIFGAAGPASPSLRYGCVATHRRLRASPLSSITSGIFRDKI